MHVGWSRCQFEKDINIVYKGILLTFFSSYLFLSSFLLLSAAKHLTEYALL